MPEEEAVSTDPQVEERDRRATRYFETDLQGQRSWYSSKASRYKRSAELLGFLVIAAGVTTAFIPTISKAPWVPIATAALGAMIALTEGWQRIARYGERWMAYRIASERMKRERRLYVNGAGDYRHAADEEDAFLRFVEVVEAIIAEEQQIYWPSRTTEAPASLPPRQGGDAGTADRSGSVVEGAQNAPTS
jgi:hypothetical protein